jgi:hypothetical protein
MDGQLFSVDSNTPAITSIKPAVRRRYCAARAARDLKDVRMLSVRVKNPTTLGDDLIDFGAGYHASVIEWRAALLNPAFLYTARERRDIEFEIKACAACEAACREELASVPPWTQMAKDSSWKEMADVARLRDLTAS